MSFRSLALPRLLTFSLPLLALTACNDDPIVPNKPAATVYDHTVVAYIVAENSLSSYLVTDLCEMATGHGAIPEGSQLLAYIDDRREPRLYRITAQQDTVRLYSWRTDICSTDSASMCDVLDKVKEYSPQCEHYDLIMSSHASGWIPPANRWRTRSFGIDNNTNDVSNNGVEMSVTTLRDVLQTKLGRVGYIFFDACYMQCIEVCHELRTVADYIVASPTEIPGSGADYTSMMPCFFSSNAPVRIVEQYYNDEVAKHSPYAGVVISAVKTSETPDLAIAAQPIVQQLCAEGTTVSTEGVQAYSPFHYQAMYRPVFYDMLGLALQTDDEYALNNFRLQLDRTIVSYRATQRWMTAFNAFDAYMPDITRTCGVSMFLPQTEYEAKGWNIFYHDTEWYTAAGYNLTGW